MREMDVMQGLKYRLKCLAVVRFWAAKFRAHLQSCTNKLPQSEVICECTLPLLSLFDFYLLHLSFFIDFDVVQSSIASVITDDNDDPLLQKYLPHIHFQVQSLGSPSFKKITGCDGEVAKKWRKDPSKDIQRITRTLDAFTHFVYERSKGEILFGDLQGKIL
jgi:hypothetical protein